MYNENHIPDIFYIYNNIYNVKMNNGIMLDDPGTRQYETMRSQYLRYFPYLQKYIISMTDVRVI